MSLSEQARKNRDYWNRTSDEYQARNREFIGRPEPRWGVWQLPESELQILGDVEGKDVLELGCGAAQWAILLAREGARVVGLDNSERQLEHARQAMTEAGVDFPLVHASAEDVPLPDASFDVVFCDHGATSFADPYRTVPEAARLLRAGGVFAFAMTSPLAWVCWNEATDEIEPRLHEDYFGIHHSESPDGSVTFQLPYGEWIRVARREGLVVEDLVEPRPPAGATTTYGFPLEWSRNWPCECIWRFRKR